VVRYLVNGLGHDGIEDGDVPRPELVQVVAFPMRHGTFFECRSESCSHHLAVNLAKLSIQVSTNDYLGLRVLSNYALYQADNSITPLYHEAFMTWFQVHVEDVDLLSS